MTTKAAWLLVALFGMGCGHDTAARRAEGDLTGVAGFDTLEGKVKLEEAPPGVRVIVWLENAPPGPKSVHVHERGDCSNPLVETMGKPFVPRGAPAAASRKPGDLGKLVVRDDGSGALELTTQSGNLKPGDPLSLANRAIVVFQGDDKGAAPSGEARKPLACAVIQSG